MAIFVTPRAEVAQAVAAIWGLQLGNTTMTDVLALVDKNSVSARLPLSPTLSPEGRGRTRPLSPPGRGLGRGPDAPTARR